MKRFGVGGHPKKHFYTRYDIADAAGRNVRTVRNAISKGELDPDDLKSVVRWVAVRVKFSKPVREVGNVKQTP